MSNIHFRIGFEHVMQLSFSFLSCFGWEARTTLEIGRFHALQLVVESGKYDQRVMFRHYVYESRLKKAVKP